MFESSSPLFFINLEKIIKLKIALQYYSLFKLCLHVGSSIIRTRASRICVIYLHAEVF